MRVTVCELPHEPELLAAAWSAICTHTRAARSETVVLPEIAFSAPLWCTEAPDLAVWREAESQHDAWMRRLGELGVSWVVGTRPITRDGARFNEGFLWSRASGLAPLRRKYYLPDETDAWEARWFARGDAAFPGYEAGALRFGLNICTELWALDTFRGYARDGVHAVIAPRATAAATTGKWIAVGTVAAVASGAYCLSSNRVHRDGSCAGVGFAIDPDGALLARTSAQEPACTVEVDPARAELAATTYPRSIFTRP